MNRTVDRALKLWALAGSEFSLVATRENAVYKVTADGRTYALRLHRKGYRSDGELSSELAWMAAVEAAGIHVPAPIASASGKLLHLIDGIQVDLLAWLQGDTVDGALDRATLAERAAIFRRVGVEMAKLHDACDAWTPPPGFQRCKWDRQGLLGDRPLWDRFWCNPALTADERALLEAFRKAAGAELIRRKNDLDYGLIHADLVPANMLIDAARLYLIDFDDGGFGFRMFDIATALFKYQSAPDYPALQEALLDGYLDLRPADLGLLDLFLALRATTYVGWNIARMSEDASGARNQRFISQAVSAVNRYLERS